MTTPRISLGDNVLKMANKGPFIVTDEPISSMVPDNNMEQLKELNPVLKGEFTQSFNVRFFVSEGSSEVDLDKAADYLYSFLLKDARLLHIDPEQLYNIAHSAAKKSVKQVNSMSLSPVLNSNRVTQLMRAALEDRIRKAIGE